MGNATVTDSREAQARFDLATAQEIAAENDLRVKQLALDQLVGLVVHRAYRWRSPSCCRSPAPPTSTPGSTGPSTSTPAVQQARMALDIARMETAKAKTGHLPTVDLHWG